MNIDTLKTAKAEAKRFLEKVKELEVRVKKDGHFAWYGCAESGAVQEWVKQKLLREGRAA